MKTAFEELASLDAGRELQAGVAAGCTFLVAIEGKVVERTAAWVESATKPLFIIGWHPPASSPDLREV